MDKNISNSIEYWNRIHKKYDREDIKYDDWLDSFLDIIEKCETPILDLGCGSGNNTLYLINHNKRVIACDLSENAIKSIIENFPEIEDAKYFNMLDGIPYQDNSFDIIIADLSLHYFKKEDTIRLIEDLKRILKQGGHIILRVNSINDINHGAGQGLEVEKHLYETDDGRLKRFFDEDDIRSFFKDFNIEYLNEEIMTRYKLEKRLYKVCVRK